MSDTDRTNIYHRKEQDNTHIHTHIYKQIQDINKMPKSKRKRKVALTKTEGKGAQLKIDLVEKIRDSVDSFKFLYVFSYENMRTNMFKKVRQELKESRLFLGKNKVGGIKLKNQWAHQLIWDCIIFDEYHYGAWNENSKGILSKEDKLIEQEKDELQREEGNENTQKIWDESLSPLKTNHYLYLSGTPFRALASGEFIEEQIFNWTYTDEQEAKENWEGDNNPYESLPRMVMMTYEMPENITQITDAGEFDQFNLNEFFKAEGEGTSAKFKHEDYVQKWLDLIRGNGFNNMYIVIFK